MECEISLSVADGPVDIRKLTLDSMLNTEKPLLGFKSGRCLIFPRRDEKEKYRIATVSNAKAADVTGGRKRKRSQMFGNEGRGENDMITEVPLSGTRG